MKKITQLSMILGVLVLLFACGQNEESNQALDVLDPNNRNQEDGSNEEREAQLGFVRYTEEEVAIDDENEEIVIDREQVADLITRLSLQSGNFAEVATLVTDKEVVIAYEKKEGKTEKEASEVAKKTAQSILPQFFTIHTTSNPYHMDEIYSLHSERTDNASDQQVVEKIIQGITEEDHEPNRR